MKISTGLRALRAGLPFALAAIALWHAGDAWLSTQAAGRAVKIIAHRGGVVGDEYAENSPAALQAAIDRGYWMIEVDIRESKDGRLVVQHDPDFERFFGDKRLLADMTWDRSAGCAQRRAIRGPWSFMSWPRCAAASSS